MQSHPICRPRANDWLTPPAIDTCAPMSGPFSFAEFIAIRRDLIRNDRESEACPAAPGADTECVRQIAQVMILGCAFCVFARPARAKSPSAEPPSASASATASDAERAPAMAPAAADAEG